ncbi:MAG: phosphatidate cytidylyltransferase [Sulfuricellaceae bacterium]|nr:phosphatidate cytidylyltransferase [Sulfuricellaceae bacterium]
MLKTRIVTAAALLAIFLSALFLLDPISWSLLLIGLVLIGSAEWARLAGYGRILRVGYMASTGLLCGLMLSFLLRGDGGLYSAAGSFIGIVAGTISLAFWLLLAPIWLMRKWKIHHPVLLALVGWILLLPTWFALVELRNISPWLLLGAMGAVWVADSMAYFTGRRFGKRKLAPAISPGKTWEGVLGALVGATLYGLALVWLASQAYGVVAALWLITLFSIEGDLFESWMKRVAGFKDSGSLLPGHGGVLDRIDALTSTLPLLTFFLIFYRF